jgi:hypothetical protein
MADTARYSDYVPNTNLALNKGSLFIRKVTLVPDNKIEVFAGTFGFSFTSANDTTYQVSYGRFDYKVDMNDQFAIIN